MERCSGKGEEMKHWFVLMLILGALTVPVTVCAAERVTTVMLDSETPGIVPGA